MLFIKNHIFIKGAWGFVFILVLSIVYTSCSNKTLSFFFDGVPTISNDSITINNNSLAIQDTTLNPSLKKKVTPPSFYHPPYQEKQCDNCHDQNERGKLTQPMPNLCFTCHEDFKTKYKFIHGPVASGSCTACHNPHVTKIKKLLIRDKQELCLFCHNQKQVLANEVHTDIGETSCTECHNPHGGEDKFILR